ncbi:MAG: MFS transporter [Marmoricola sp.]
MSVEAAVRPQLGASFWRLFASSSTSNLSDGIMQAALPLLAATLSRDPVAVSTLGAVAFLPWLLFAIPAGTIVDRVNRRTAMATANLARAGILGLLAVAVVTGHVSLPVLYVAAFLLGCCETVYDSAARAILPRVVTRPQLERGNSLLTTAESVGNIFLGAPVGAWLFALAISLPLWANSGAYLVAALLALTVAGRFAVERTEQTSMREDTVEGLRWLVHHEFFRRLMVVTGLAAAVHTLPQGILVLFALQNLGLDERGYGLALAGAGVGAIVGAMLSPTLTRLAGRTRAMGAAQTLSAVAILFIAFWQHPVGSPALYAVSAGAISMFNVQIMSVRQAMIPDHLFGRVQGAYRTVIWGGIPIGMLAGGVLGSWLGLPAVFLVSGVCGIALAIATWWILHAHAAEIAAAFAEE